MKFPGLQNKVGGAVGGGGRKKAFNGIAFCHLIVTLGKCIYCSKYFN